MRGHLLHTVSDSLPERPDSYPEKRPKKRGRRGQTAIRSVKQRQETEEWTQPDGFELEESQEGSQEELQAQVSQEVLEEGSRQATQEELQEAGQIPEGSIDEFLKDAIDTLYQGIQTINENIEKTGDYFAGELEKMQRPKQPKVSTFSEEEQYPEYTVEERAEWIRKHTANFIPQIRRYIIHASHMRCIIPEEFSNESEKCQWLKRNYPSWYKAMKEMAIQDLALS